MSFDLLSNGLSGTLREQADKFTIFPQTAQQDVLGFYVRRAKLTCFVMGEENRPARLFRVSLDHGTTPKRIFYDRFASSRDIPALRPAQSRRPRRLRLAVG